MSTPEHVAMIEATVARQRAFFQTGATRPVAVRVAALHKLKREMQARETSSWTPSTPTCTSPTPRGTCELGLNLDELGYLARKLPSGPSPSATPPPGPSSIPPATSWPRLRGGAGDVPLNYPYLLSLTPGAIAAGNCVVLKPSAYAPTPAGPWRSSSPPSFPRTGSL